MNKTTRCWCGNTKLISFSKKFIKCEACGTLLAAEMPNSDISKVKNDAEDFYGRNYWFLHQEDELGFPNIKMRSRRDLPERCLYWLKTVLKYRLPPGNALELGCSHGGFIALLRWIGFDGMGLELSPWVAEYAHKTFDVPVLVGPLVDQHIKTDSLDMILLMDVLEHVPDPVETLHNCLNLMKKNGILIIQTPQFFENKTYEEMKDKSDPFLEQLKEKDHLYLFTQNSIVELLSRLQCEHVRFEKAIFNHYDMFIVASRMPLSTYTCNQQSEVLSSTASGRIIQALLDLDDEKNDIQAKFTDSEEDRIARLEIIKKQGHKIGELEAEVDRWLEQSKKLQEERSVLEAERNELQFRVKDLSKHFQISEKDREARLEVIKQQGEQISKLEAEVDRWLEQSKKLQEERNQQDERISILETELNRWLESRIYYFSRLLNLDGILLGKKNVKKKQHEIKRRRYSERKSIDKFQKEIDHFNESQSNKELLNEIRIFNHQIMDNFNSIVSLNGALLLDIGASPHGYALERALFHKVALYVGIGLDIKKPEHVRGESNNTGLLINMDATSLKFPDDMFDAVISGSTFEHIHSVSKALTEIHRILKKGGHSLITFEPIWSYSRGHHLHHFGECSELIPPWAHLEWTPEQMKRFLADKWPVNSPIHLEKAIDWIYHGQDLNRMNIQEFQFLFETSPLKIEWMVNLRDDREKYNPTVLKRVSEMTGLSPQDLTTKGISVLLTKKP